IGIFARSGQGQDSAYAHNVTTLGNNSTGILAISGSAGVQITSDGTVQTSGTSSVGIDGRAANGSVTIHANNVTTRGANSAGIYGTSGVGNVSVVTTGAVDTSGDLSTGIRARLTGGYGFTSVSAGPVHTRGLTSPGIYESSTTLAV